MADLYQILAEQRIEYQRYDHPAVFTVEDVKRLVPPLPAARTKNLFLRDHRGRRHFLVIVPADKRVDIKALPGAIGSSRLSFGSAKRLKEYLEVDAGSVTILALDNENEDGTQKSCLISHSSSCSSSSSMIFFKDGIYCRLLMRVIRLVISVMRMPYFLFCKTTSPLAINLSFARTSTGSPSSFESVTVDPGPRLSNS